MLYAPRNMLYASRLELMRRGSTRQRGGIEMLTEYLTAVLESAHFEIIDDVEPYYGNIPALSGVWATGKTLEECRGNLAAALEGWVFFSIARGQELPALNGVSIAVPQRVTV
jgi:predicted RNase H-like HicB family nuclease